MSIHKVFEEIRDELLKQVALFERQGFGQVIARWRKRDFMLGKRLARVSVSGEHVDVVSLDENKIGKAQQLYCRAFPH